MAYTRKDLDELCEWLNKKESRRNQPSYVTQSHNGYTAVDMSANGIRLFNLVTGTAKECAFAVMEDALDYR